MDKKIIGIITYQPKKIESYKLTRTVTPQECPWLYRTFEIGEIVFKYPGYTFGCIGKKGLAFSTLVDTMQFFELPQNAVSVVNK